MNTETKLAIGAFITLLVLGIALALIALLASGNLHVWEDGSFAIGNFPYAVKGCLPFALCQ